MTVVGEDQRTDAATRPPPDAGFDLGIFPWTLTCLAWLLAPMLPLFLGIPLIAYAWSLLMGVAVAVALLVAAPRWLRGRRASVFTRRALQAAILQAGCLLLFYVAGRLLRRT